MSEIDEKSLEAAARAVMIGLDRACYRDDAIWAEDLDMFQRRDKRGYTGEDNPIGIARAAIEAFLSAEKEAGRAMMPREATDAMIDAGVSALSLWDPAEDRMDWAISSVATAMFDAASPALSSLHSGEG